MQFTYPVTPQLSSQNSSFGSAIEILAADAILVSPGIVMFHGGIAIRDGRILATGPLNDLRMRFAGSAEFFFPSHVLCPGFINAHTHLELSYLRGKIVGPIEFPQWVETLISMYPTRSDAATTITAAAHEGAAECIRFGVTTVGDITRQSSITRAALQAGPLRVVSYGEITALGNGRQMLDSRLSAAASSEYAGEFVSIGLSPHAPYSVEGPALEKIVAAAENKKVPLMMHLAENSGEVEFLRALEGPLGRQWTVLQSLNLLDSAVPLFAGGPIRWAKHHHLLDADVPVILAHVNYANDAELEILATSRASVAWCPRTRAYFGHDRHTRHPWPAMLNRHINVCLATDSLASNPDLSVLREASFLLSQQPACNPVVLLEMITTRPAAALGMADQIGQLSPGYSADAVMLPLNMGEIKDTEKLPGVILREAPEPAAVWIKGRRVK